MHKTIIAGADLAGLPLTVLNEWLFDTIEPWLKGHVLESGSTTESISTIFVQRGRPIHLSTPDHSLRAHLKSLYQQVPVIRKVHSIKFHRQDFEQAYPAEAARIFDTIIVFNAMENGTYDQEVIRNARYLLKERGRLILLAPIFTALYDGLELDIEELVKYNLSSIRKLLTDQMEILLTKYFNLATNTGYAQSGLSVIVVARKG